MTRLGRLLVWFWVALAIWLSDRWAWTIQALGGVMVGVSVARLQRQHREEGKGGLPPFEAGSLLILLVLTSVAYLYLLYLMVQLGKAEGVSVGGLLLGLTGLSMILVGLGAVFLLKVKLPRWLSQVWDWLLEERS